MNVEASPSPWANSSQASRQRIMRVCTLATDQELEHAAQKIGNAIEVVDVRRPETGLVMLRGRIGGDGAAFNVGEATVTRAVVRLASGELGYSYLLGRSHKRARLAAILDALGQASLRHSAEIEETFLKPIEARSAEKEKRSHEETAATRVNFFTLVRGED